MPGVRSVSVGVEVADVVAIAKWPSLGVAAFYAYKLFVFACQFLAGRFDARQTRLEALDQRVSKSLSDRLSHLERIEEANRVEIGLLREAVSMLATELREQDPTNPKLKVVASMLRAATPIPPADPALDDLVQQADRARRGARNASD